MCGSTDTCDYQEVAYIYGMTRHAVVNTYAFLSMTKTRGQSLAGILVSVKHELSLQKDSFEIKTSQNSHET